MQTQLDAPQQIVTEPPVLNLSGTNVLDPIDILQSVRINDLFRVILSFTQILF
jgi:hypothetical protein